MSQGVEVTLYIFIFYLFVASAWQTGWWAMGIVLALLVWVWRYEPKITAAYEADLLMWRACAPWGPRPEEDDR